MGSPDVTRVGKHIIEQNRDSLKPIVLTDHLKRNLKVLADIVVVITIYGLSFIDTGIKMLHSLKEAPKDLAEYSIANIRHLFNRLPELTATGFVTSILQGIKLGSPNVTRETAGGFYLSINTKPENPELHSALLAPHSPVDLSDFNNFNSTTEKIKETGVPLRLAFRLAITDWSDKIQPGKHMDNKSNMITSILQGIKLGSPNVTRETAGGFYLSINTKPENPELYSALLAPHSPVDLSDFNNFNSTTEKIKETGVPLRLAFRLAITDWSDKIQPGKHMDNKSNMSMLESNLNQLTAQSVQHTTESAQHTMNVGIIVANRSFLIEEINTMALVRAFQDQGITCFDGLDGTLEGQQSAEGFLTILEEKNLLDHLLAILREEGMTYVLDRLNNCRNAYSADPQILRPNISNNHTNILDNLDIDDVREIFIERGVFSSSMFDEIEKKCSESENQMNAVLIEIKTSGPRAMRTLVDVLYIIHSDSLADSLIMGTPNELQEIQDNIQID